MQELQSERRIVGEEGRAVYKEFQESIKANTCTPRDLRNALRDKTITVEQCNKLSLLLNDRFYKILNFDALTRIPNRFSLQSNLETSTEALNSSKIESSKLPIKSILIISLDIDEFKLLNDNYGHTVGDEALKTLAISLEDSVKRTDTVFRVGGDEFIILLPITDDNPRLLGSIFERIKNNVEKKLLVKIDGKDTPFNISMGFEVLNKGSNITAEELLNKADQHMYRAKRESKEKAA